MASCRASVDLLPRPASVRAARRVLGQVLDDWNAPHDRADAELVVSELVANAVDHAGGERLTLEVTLSDTWLRIAVVDGVPTRPVVHPPSTDRPRGRGMRIVTVIADRWGVEPCDGGKRVWSELSCL